MSLAVNLYSELNILSFVIMVIIAVSALKANASVTHRTLLFEISALCAAIANIFDFLWNLGKTYSVDMSLGLRGTVNFFYFILLGISTYCWFLYTENVLQNKRLSWKFMIIAAIPLMVLVVMLVISSFTGWVFYFDANGEYHRGPLFYFQHIFSYGYILYASLVCLHHAHANENYARRSELLGLASFVIPPIVCTIIQLFFQDLPILSVGIVVSFLLVYIHTMRNMVSTDELTQIAHRRELLRYASSEIKNLKPDEKLFFMFIDIDKFKAINDKFGHDEGDKALKVLAQTLKQVSAETDGFCARYGGDEFTYMVKCEDEDEVLEIRKRLRELCAKKSLEASLQSELEVSAGLVKYHESMGGLQQLISAADAAMYEEKKRKSGTNR